MEYRNSFPATFLERPNRFIARCLVDGAEVRAHVKNTGRCRELLIPGATVHLEHAPSPSRRTAYSLIAVEKGQRLINLDSQAPNHIFREGLESGVITLPALSSPITAIHPEIAVGSSRLDFFVEACGQCAFVEVKGVTLEEDGVVLFPDAPTQRGIKHLHELKELIKPTSGPLWEQVQRNLLAKSHNCPLGAPLRCGELSRPYAYLALIVQMQGVRYFTPNNRTHPAFGRALCEARQAGVEILCYDCHVTPGSIVAKDPVPIVL